MLNKFTFCCLILLLLNTFLRSQTVVVTDDSTYIAGQASAVLDLKSTTKGFLPPRVTAAQKTAIVSPAAGLLVYQIDETTGYYLWTGTKWDPLVSGLGGNGAPVIKTTAATLLKTETFVLASNDILLTLPTVISADNGLSITIKNIGSYLNLVQVKGNGTTTIDGTPALSNHTRWHARTYIAYEGNWLLKEKVNGRTTSEYEVSPHGSWTTIPEALEYLAIHMSGPSVIRLGSGVHFLSTTQNISLPFLLTITGLAFRESTISAANGLAGTPMFNCSSAVHFRLLLFDATSLSGYGNAANEDAIWLTGANVSHEIKDDVFTGFNKALVLKNNVGVLIFGNSIINSKGAGIEIAAGVAIGVALTITETNFINCTKGVRLLSGLYAVLGISGCAFQVFNPTDVCIDYVPATFTPFTSLFISNNTWNIVGIFIQGFDFTRSDGRDANAFVENNAGDVKHNPSCKIDVVDNTSTTTLTNSNTLYKAIWTNTSFITKKWAIANNRITFLPLNKRDGLVMITGNISVAASNKTISIVLVKNGVVATPIGETSLRITTSNQPFQFSTVIYLQNINKNDYFELWCRSASNNDVVRFQDIQWLTETK